MISAPLPNLDTLDTEALKKMVVAQHNRLLEQQQLASHQIEQAGRQIEHLKLVIDKYKRMIFGTKSEKLKGELEQLEFQLEELETEQAAGKNKNHILREQRISPGRVLRASHCPRIFRAKSSPILLRALVIRIAGVPCVSLAKMYPSSWNAFRPATR